MKGMCSAAHSMNSQTPPGMNGDDNMMMGDVDFDTRMFCEFDDEEKEVYLENTDSGGHSNHRRMRNCGLMTPIDELS